MRIFKEISYFLMFLLLAMPGFTAANEEKPDDQCPVPLPKPSKTTFPERAATESQQSKFDAHEEIGNISTDIVNHDLFNSEDTLFNFIRLVYEDISFAIDQYKTNNNIDPAAISFVFKGGNVLRMIANRTFDLLPPEASTLLKERYGEFFTRSDSDFSVYIDEKKLGDKKWPGVFEDMTLLVNKELGNIRDKFMADPSKYFSLFKLDQQQGSELLGKYLGEVKDIEAVKEKGNKWYKTNFKQVQLLDYRANPSSTCPFQGRYDTRSEVKDGMVTSTPLSETPHWIVNTDNRNKVDHWQSDPTKIDKFNLGKASVVIEYTFEQQGKLQKKTFGGELIDISIIDRDDDTLREFLDQYDQNVATYTLTLDSPPESFQFKAHSVPYLARNIRSIIFDTFDRPWHSPKYIKRINRIFFLSIIEMLGSYGLGSKKINKYKAEIKEHLLKPMAELYITTDYINLGKLIEKNAQNLNKRWPDLKQSNAFWLDMAKLINNRLIPAPQKSDQDEFKALLELINTNVDFTEKLSTMPAAPLKIDELYNINMKDFF